MTTLHDTAKATEIGVWTETHSTNPNLPAKIRFQIEILFNRRRKTHIPYFIIKMNI